MTLPALVRLLRCPDCRGRLAYTAVPQPEAAAGACGLLRCGCTTYPVLDGVPILRHAAPDVPSPAGEPVMAGGLAGAVARIADGDALGALAELLTFPVCPWPLNRFEAGRALSLRAPVQAAGRAAGRAQTERRLWRRAALTAEDWLAAFYRHAPSADDPFADAFFRFSRPSHLATSGVLAALPLTARPLLGVGCGYGHLLHAPTAAGQAAIGLDRSFHTVWVARHYVAPGAGFVCADPERPLPIARAAAAAAVVPAPIPFARDPAAGRAELERATGGGTIVLAGLPPEAVEGATEALAGTVDRWHAFADEALLDRYLAGQTADLSRSSPAEELADARTRTVVYGGPRLGLDPPRTRPHAAGVLCLNPMYRLSGGRARFEMPSPTFATANAAMRTYMPPMADWPAAVADAVARGERTREVKELLMRFVVIGVPARYARAARPAPLAADREATEPIGSRQSGRPATA